jgi:hypothetical protein
MIWLMLRVSSARRQPDLALTKFPDAQFVCFSPIAKTYRSQIRHARKSASLYKVSISATHNSSRKLQAAKMQTL